MTRHKDIQLALVRLRRAFNDPHNAIIVGTMVGVWFAINRAAKKQKPDELEHYCDILESCYRGLGDYVPK